MIPTDRSRRAQARPTKGSMPTPGMEQATSSSTPMGRLKAAPTYGRAYYHVAEHGVGFHFASFGSFLNCEVITNGCRRYIGSVVTIVTTSSGDPLGSVISSKYSVRLVLSL